MTNIVEDKIAGLLFGTAVGDSLGLPFEGLKPATIARRGKGIWKHRFVFGKGMMSDDSEHAMMLAQSLLLESHDVKTFRYIFASKLRCWLLGLPAGIGFGTLKAILKLWLFFPPDKSGVPSAGNGPAMRSAVLGAAFGKNASKIKAFVKASTRITHTDPRAERGALAVALLAGIEIEKKTGGKLDINETITLLKSLSGEDDGDWQTLMDAMLNFWIDRKTVSEFALSLGQGKGVSGYVYHTVPIAIYAWARHYGDFKATLESLWACGGDTDTTGAIAGALAGASVGKTGIPADWIWGIWDWPRSKKYMQELSDNLALLYKGDATAGPVSLFWLALPLRNLFFMIVVLLHGFRRLLPPY